LLDTATSFKFVEPRQQGSVPVEHCIRRRRSVRGFRDRKLTEDELGQLLWAAQGITATDGRRAVSSAGALYPLQLYAACGDVGGLAGGVYRYSPEHHQLLLVAEGHQREKLVEAARGQEWIASAPAVVCIAAAFQRTTVKYGQRGRGYVYMEAGHAAESLMLQAVALGLATTMVGAFADDEVKHLLHLAANEAPLCLLPVGAPEILDESR
jgi:SagB-type dehydrogenase family enzyme